MSFDPSRNLYPHPPCGTLPCSCTYQHRPLTFQLLPCYAAGCQHSFYTMGELQEHHLMLHERPLNVSSRVALLMASVNGQDER